MDPTLNPMTKYYPVCVHLNDDCWLLWYGGRTDGVVLERARHPRVLVRATLADLRIAAKERDMAPEEKATRYDLSLLEPFLQRPSDSLLDTTLLLDTWNLTRDVECSLGLKSRVLQARGRDHIYDKLFWGQNLPAVTPEGCHYEPVWKKPEVEDLARVGRHCLNRLTRELS